MDRREALQVFLTEVVPHFRDEDRWEDLAWNLIDKLTAEQLEELTAEYASGGLVEMSEEWSS